MKKLSDILSDIKIKSKEGSLDIMSSSIHFDSRLVESGTTFFAIPGVQVDGHKFIPTAVEKGAKAIVCENMPEETSSDVTYVQVENSAEALAYAASAFYDHPSKKLKLAAITGTNGKTTTVTLLYNLFKSFGYKCGLLSTIANYINDEQIQATHTTPDSIQINRLLAEMVNKGVEYCFMEASSHSIFQHRVTALDFDVAMFSNITHDHLDYHKTFKNYIEAKKKLFDNLSPNAWALINVDDKNGRYMVQNTKAQVKTYALKTPADFKAKVVESHFDGMQLNINGQETWMRLIGEFNAYNVLSVYATACLFGKNEEETLTRLSNLETVDGRFQYVRNSLGKTAIVDYAHTPDALKNVLNTVREIKTKNQKVITVTGAGGDRDKTKRSEMARIAADMSDKVILTSDNPRNEEPEAILNDMLKGAEGKTNVLSITDRKEAIKAAVMFAADNDIILIAGKGHENYQEIKGVKHHFNDKEIVKQFMGV